MSVFVGVESVVMNALIDAKEICDKQELTFKEIVRYGETAAQIYQKETGEEAILLLSEADQVSMMENYPKYLDTKAYVESRVFRLQDDAPMDEIKELFRWLLSINLLNSFLSPETSASLRG
ncbi:MAG: hypothetical protein OSJ69_17935 [Acetatifactor sp.]|jgi:hypothetical protein|nr:hypothetical protein [Acetatifactor sp.]